VRRRRPRSAGAGTTTEARKGVLGGVPVSRLEPARADLRDLIVVACTETVTDDDRAAYVAALKEVL